jgi:Primase X
MIGKVGLSFLGSNPLTEKNSGYRERFCEQTLVSKVNYCLFMIPAPHTYLYLFGMDLSTGLNCVLGHFQEPIFPRSISTKTTEDKQILVNGRQEALARFAQANCVDCRISAYPPGATENPSGLECFQGLRITTPRNLIVIIDLDRSNFRSERALQLALAKTLENIRSALGVEPTVLWSGNGYHVYLILESQVNLENVKQFTELKINNVSLKFLRFAESFLSGGKSDKAHNATVSFKNCMMRIPGSINSKNNCEVRTVQEWDGFSRPTINYLLADFCGYLANERSLELKEVKQWQRRQARDNPSLSQGNSRDSDKKLPWIERLLEQTPIANGRKYCIWRILVPYLINWRHLSQEECTQIIRAWLDQCSALERLDFNVNKKIAEAVARVKKYGPAYHQKIRQEYPELYNILIEKRVLT